MYVDETGKHRDDVVADVGNVKCGCAGGSGNFGTTHSAMLARLQPLKLGEQRYITRHRGVATAALHSVLEPSASRTKHGL